MHVLLHSTRSVHSRSVSYPCRFMHNILSYVTHGWQLTHQLPPPPSCRPEDHAALALSERLLGVREHHNPEVRLVADTEAAWLAGVAQRVPGQGRSGSCRLEQYAGKAGEHWRKQVGGSQGCCSAGAVDIQQMHV